MAFDRPMQTTTGAVCPMLNGSADVLLAYAERRMAVDDAAALERHAAQCEECRRVLDAQRAVWDALDEWEPEPVSADFNRRLYQAIEAEQAQPWWRRLVAAPVFTRWNSALPVAVSCVLLLGVFLVRTPEPAEEMKQAVLVEPVDVEKLDRALDDIDLLRELNQELRDDSKSNTAI